MTEHNFDLEYLTSFAFDLIPLVEILIAKEVNRIENVPSFFLHCGKLCILASKYDPASLAALNIGHKVFLSDVAKVFLAYFKRPQPQIHLLFVCISACELYKTF